MQMHTIIISMHLGYQKNNASILPDKGLTTNKQDSHP